MLTMTQEASSVVRKFTASPRLDESSGVRIGGRSDARNLSVRAVNGPHPGDLVIEESGARLYLEPEAAGRVRGKVLDVRDATADRVEFLLTAS
ncbi:Fe-S cluster assembly protein HesB [Nocardioides sp.]|uniref:Fe-S cluster assembly protein HesB n=1 Tax=Nocardioides sp. TaxID=35761 RepID=UPI003D0A836C